MRSFLRTTAQSAKTLLGSLSLALALLPTPAASAPAPGGSLIRNIAEAQYFNPALGIVERVFSNPVEAQVALVPALEVTGHTELLLSRGAIGQYHFTVANVGNVPLATELRIEDREAAALTLGGTLIPDFNGNGRIDPDEAAFDLSTPIPLAAGEQIALIYEFRVSVDAPVSSTLTSALLATASAGSALLQGEADGLSRILSGTLELEKAQVVAEGTGADRLTYTLHLRNNSDSPAPGYRAVNGDPIMVDDIARHGILLRDEIPLNTVFAGIETPGGMTALYHLRGMPPQEYLSTAPADPAEIDAVAFLHDGDFPVGHAADPSFSVRVPAALGALRVENTAQTYLGGGEEALVLPSNTTLYDRTGGEPAQIGFEDPATGEDQPFSAPGSDTRLRVIAGACNLTGATDSLTVTVRSTLTGDVETLTATETGPNTGVFLTAPLPLAQMSPVMAGDQVMATDFGDGLSAWASCDGTALTDELPVTPGNFLFNSVTNAPVEGIVVALLDAATGMELARTLTDPRGFFTFSDMPAGDYRYAVLDAPAWVFPSERADTPGMGRRVTEAGFGTAFTHGGGALFVSDIPVDPFYGAPLALQKAADRDRVSMGEFVTYSLTFSNNMHQALIGAELRDRPAPGFALVPGSVTLDGAPLADPQLAPGGDMLFSLGLLEPLSSHELTYVMQVTAAAREGRNENAAILTGRQAGTGTPRSSQTVRAVVRLDSSGGVFARQGTVVGAVFMDCNGNGLRDKAADEPGIPGVRIVTQEGLSVVTDIDGQYSLQALRPVTHAFLVQPETLPAETAVQVTRTNDLLRGGSRLVPLKKGELRAENFAVEACTPEAMQEVSRRRAHFEEKRQPASMNAADLPIDGRRSPARAAHGEAGIATTTQLTPGMVEAWAAEADAAPETLAEAAASASRRQPLDSLIRSLDNAPGFLDFEGGEAVSRQTQNIRVKGKADLTLALLLNGRELGADRVGERSSWEKNNVQALEYVAVKLAPGENTLTLVGRDGFGIERVRKELRLTAPGKPARIEIILPETAAANPTAVVPVVVRVLDAGGRPVPASGTVTLAARRALWDVTDIRSGTPGVQAYLDNGEATFGLIPPQVSGPDLITVRGAFGAAEASITFTPDLEERVIIGVIEGAVSLGGTGKGGGAVLGKGEFSAFEQTITGLRGELYLKGVIRGDALLTLRYSSDRDTEDRLFRDIRGDEYYPVYGDNSERGADAQSASNLYVKVEKGRSYVLYGDIAIEPEASAFKLGGLRRVATGAKGHWEADRVSVTVFATRTAQEQMVREIPGRGVSGPYSLDLGGYVQGSERVELLVRDAEGGDILSATPLRRGTDYLLDFFRNTITFDSPVRQFDAEGNPVSIRVTYEVEADGADKYWLYGGEVNYAASESTTLGARAVHADAPRGNPARVRMHSAYLRHEDGAGGLWEAELARSENAEGKADAAARLSYEIQTESRRFSFEAIHTGREFQAQGGLARPGTDQIRLSYGAEIDSRSSLALGAEYSRDRANDTSRLTFDAVYGRQLSKGLRGEIGLEYSQSLRGGATEEETALLLGAHWMPAARPGTVIEAELRAPLSGRRPAELTLGMYREPKQGWRVYNEVALQLGGETTLTRATLGFSYQLNDWLSGRTELSRGSALGETTMVQGVSVEWDINDNTAFSADIEHSRNLDRQEPELTSVALGMKWHSADEAWVGDADLETTWEESGTTHYASFGLAGQVTPNLTVLGRSRVALDRRNGSDIRRMRTRIGAAYRPMEDARLEVLAWYEHRLEQKHSRTETHMWSVDAHYEVTEDLRINGKYAGQHQSVEAGNGPAASTTTQLVQGGLTQEFGDDRFQLGVNVAHLWDSEGNATQGFGAEFGFVPQKGTLLAIGYNKAGRHVAGQGNLYQDGVYVRFNLLLDNSLWARLDQFLGN